MCIDLVLFSCRYDVIWMHHSKKSEYFLKLKKEEKLTSTTYESLILQPLYECII